jgi:TRAP-type C4-dicarboxylate transport system permease small subunit
MNAGKATLEPEYVTSQNENFKKT